MSITTTCPTCGRPLPEPTNWIFTFGAGHVHPVTGESLDGCFVRSPDGLDFHGARTWMVLQFSDHWANQYRTEAKAGVHEYGLREVAP
jgi:hypothetical protein